MTTITIRLDKTDDLFMKSEVVLLALLLSSVHLKVKQVFIAGHTPHLVAPRSRLVGKVLLQRLSAFEAHHGLVDHEHLRGKEGAGKRVLARGNQRCDLVEHSVLDTSRRRGCDMKEAKQLVESISGERIDD